MQTIDMCMSNGSSEMTSANFPFPVHCFYPRPEVPDLRGRDALGGLPVAVGVPGEDEAAVDLGVWPGLGGEGERSVAQAAHHEGKERVQEETRVRH